MTDDATKMHRDCHYGSPMFIEHRLVRRRLTAIVTVCLLALGAAGCSSNAATKSAPATAAGTAPSATSSPERAYAVGERSETFTDATRPTSGNAARKIPAADSRTLPTMILYPADGSPAGDDGPVATTADAHVADGRFPLVVFSHGVTGTGPTYKALLARWARAGFVVIAPTYPMTSGEGAWADLPDYVNQPADVSFLITQMIELNSKDGDPLAGHINTDEIAAAGHSLGGITTLGFYNSCCRDERVKAALAFAGVMLPFGDGNWDNPPAIPLLLVHGQDDSTVPYGAGSEHTFDTLNVPRAFVTFPTAGHTDIFGDKDDPTNGISTNAAAIAFLRLELDHDDRDWKRLGGLLDEQGRAWIQVADGMPEAGPGGTYAKAAASDSAGPEATS